MMKRYVKTLAMFGLLLAHFNGLAYKPINKTDIQLIIELRVNWSASLQRKQLQKAMDLFTEDAIFYSPGDKSLVGKKAISTLYRQVMTQFTSHCHLQSEGVSICGSLAYDSGSYSETLVDTQTRKINVLKGSYLMTLKKQAGNVWKITRIMWTQLK
jgi:ketosteroid isomerase-like protein